MRRKLNKYEKKLKMEQKEKKYLEKSNKTTIDQILTKLESKDEDYESKYYSYEAI